MPPFVKLGGHLRLWDSAGQCWATQCNTVKALDVPAYLDGAGGRLTVWRHYMGTGNSQWQGNSPATFLDAVISSLQGRHPTYIEGPNESGLDGDGSVGATTQAFAAWTAEYVRLAHQAGFQVAAFSFSTGNPSPAQWAYFRSIGWAGADAIAMHCYWGNQGFTPYNALRFATLWQPGDPPVVVTECGRDAVEGGAAGWQANGLSAQQFIGELSQYDQLLQQYPYVLAAHVFTNGGCPDFCAFEIDPLAGILWGTGCAPAPPPPSGCTSDAQCAVGYHCVNGQCVCLGDADCQSAFGPNSVCQNGVCIQVAGACQGPADCTAFGPYYQCIGGQCVYVPPTVRGPDPTLVIGAVLAGAVIGGAIWYISQEMS